MDKKTPFNDDIMTLIMGIEPDAPGQHGPKNVPAPDKDAVEVITQIRDLCEDFLMNADKEPEEKLPEEGDEDEESEDEDEEMTSFGKEGKK